MKTDFLLYRHPDAPLIALQGVGFTAFTIILSGLSLSLANLTVSLTWLPLAAIFLWPRWSHRFATPILIGVLGFIADLLLGRLLGLSSLIFLLFFWLAKPTEREERLTLWRGWIEFALITALLLYVVFYLIGRVLDMSVGWSDLAQQILTVIAVFPLVYAMRVFLRRWLIDPNDVNYQS